MNHHVAVSWRGQWGCRAVLAAFAFGCAASAVARNASSIPPGFLAYPPYNGFVFEAVHLLPARHDHLAVVEVDDETLSNAMSAIRLGIASSPEDVDKRFKEEQENRTNQIKLTEVPAQFAVEFKAMQAAANGDAAYALGKDLPEAIRLYTAAALDFHLAHPTVIERKPEAWSKPMSSGPMDTEQLKDLDKAIPRLHAALNLPDAAKRARAVAAAYTLGRCYTLRGALGDAALAEKFFVLTRTLAHVGLPDPDGLAVASFGDQARVHRAKGDLHSTVELYAEQAARGSVEGVESLKWVAQALYKDPQGMAKVENIPLAQRLLIAYALEMNDDGLVHEHVYAPGAHASSTLDDGTMDLLLRTARRWPKKKIASPDRLAALAYRAGDFDFARKLIDAQNTPLAWWLKAKLHVANGNLVDAEAAYKKVVAMSPAVPNPDGLSPFNESAACEEMAQLERVRGEFIPAMQDQIACTRTYSYFANDSLMTYLTERVLTTAEAENVLGAIPPPPRRRTDESFTMTVDRSVLRSELAKRLVREGQYKKALVYANATSVVSVSKGDLSFDTGLSDKRKTQRDLIQDYATANDQAKHAPLAISRAAAWYQLALLIRVQHEEILDHDSPFYTEIASPEFPGVSSSELHRLKNNYKAPDQERLRWYIAFDDALNAAQLVPHRSQAYAAILCHAAHWMNQAPHETKKMVAGRDPTANLHLAWRLYVKNGAYVPWARKFGHQCPDPDFAEAAKSTWLRELKHQLGSM